MSPKFSNSDSEKLYEKVVSDDDMSFRVSNLARRNPQTGQLEEIKGGEYFTDSAQVGIEGEVLEAAFQEMPEEVMDEFVWALLDRQVKDVKFKIAQIMSEVEEGEAMPETHFSINLEHGMSDEGLRKSLEIFEGYKNFSDYLVIEIMEDGGFSKSQLGILRDFAEKTGFKFSLDDCTSGVHDLSKRENLDYFVRLYEVLGDYISHIKIDYHTVKSLYPDTTGKPIAAFEKIQENLRIIAINGMTDVNGVRRKLPSVIFESFPWGKSDDLKQDYDELEKTATDLGYTDVMYQYE